MTKVVINACYGGFGLSHLATMELAKRKGIQLYAFINPPSFARFQDMVPATDEEAEKSFLVYYYTSPTRTEGSYYSSRDIERRDDPDLLALLAEWGSERVSRKYAKLEVVDIPDGVEWEVEEYDGMEHVAEKHRVWYGS